MLSTFFSPGLRSFNHLDELRRKIRWKKRLGGFEAIVREIEPDSLLERNGRFRLNSQHRRKAQIYEHLSKGVPSVDNAWRIGKNHYSQNS